MWMKTGDRLLNLAHVREISLCKDFSMVNDPYMVQFRFPGSENEIYTKPVYFHDKAEAEEFFSIIVTGLRSESNITAFYDDIEFFHD